MNNYCKKTLSKKKHKVKSKDKKNYRSKIINFKKIQKFVILSKAPLILATTNKEWSIYITKSEINQA